VISRPHHVYNEDRNKIACANVTYYVIYDHAKRARHHRSAGLDLRGDGMSKEEIMNLTPDQALRLECARIAGNAPGARELYEFITTTRAPRKDQRDSR